MSQRPSSKQLRPRKNSRINEGKNIPLDALAAKEARETAEVRGFFWAKEFAVAIGRYHQFVSDKCREGEIKTMKGGTPYRIPYSEYLEWIKPTTPQQEKRAKYGYTS